MISIACRLHNTRLHPVSLLHSCNKCEETCVLKISVFNIKIIFYFEIDMALILNTKLPRSTIRIWSVFSDS